MEQLISPGDIKHSSPGHSGTPGGRRLRLGLMLAFLTVFLFSARLLILRRIEAGSPLPTTPARAGDLPSQLGEWQVVDFEHKILDNEFAPESSIWTLQQGTRQALVSIDGPYSEYHTTNECYRLIGWTTQTEYNYSSGNQTDRKPLNATIVRMSKPDLHGLVMYSAVDRQGRRVDPPPFAHYRHGSNVIQNVKRVLGLESRETDAAEQGREQRLPIYQIQVLYQSTAEISPEEYQQIETLFRDARQVFLSLPRFAETEERRL